MERIDIPLEDFTAQPLNLFSKQWMLLCAGDFAKNKFNMMTIGWGSFGTMWKKPFAQVVVRPGRYTYEFMEKYDDFTLTAFPPQYRDALNICGSKSGRDIDKVKETGLTPIASSKVKAPGFDQAELIIECKKMYDADFKPKHFLDSDISKNYPQKDYHRIYYGEIMAVSGTAIYQQNFGKMDIETGNWKLEVGDWKIQTGNWKLSRDDFRPES